MHSFDRLLLHSVREPVSYQFSYQLPLVSASWLRCACGSE